MPDIRQLRGLSEFPHFRADRIMRNMGINLCCLNVLSLDHSAGPAKPSTAPEKGHCDRVRAGTPPQLNSCFTLPTLLRI